MPASAVSTVVQLLPMAVLLIVLMIMPEERLQIGRVVKARPPRTPTSRQSTAGALALLVVAVIVAMVLDGPNLATLGEALVLGLLALSLVPLAGYAGQVSLCQWTFAGIGAVVMHRVMGGHSLLGLVAAAAVCGVAGGVVALPALRLRGVYLALATVAFAVLMDNTFFTATSIMGTDGNLSVGRPSLFGWHMTSNRSFDYFLAVVLALAVVGVGWLRRSTFGRRLVAMNDSPPAFAAMGLSATLTKFLIFALSAGLAGVAGALFGGLGTSVNGGPVRVPAIGRPLRSHHPGREYPHLGGRGRWGRAGCLPGDRFARAPAVQLQLPALRPGHRGHRPEPQRHGHDVRRRPRALGQSQASRPRLRAGIAPTRRRRLGRHGPRGGVGGDTCI